MVKPLYIIGVGATSTAIGAALAYCQKNKKLQAWTTNHNTPEPSIKWDSNWDRRMYLERPDKGKPETKPTATRHLLFIRHGQYVFDNDHEKRLLTALGRKQAVLTGQRLKELDLPITRLVFSTMPRAQETGRIIAKYLPPLDIEHCSMLCEGAPCPPEPPSHNWRPELSQFYEDGARIEAAFRKYVHRADSTQQEDSYEVFVCHANVIRYFICRALQLPPEAWLRMSLHNGSITWMTVRPGGRVGVRMIGDCGFMPRDHLSTT